MASGTDRPPTAHFAQIVAQWLMRIVAIGAGSVGKMRIIIRIMAI
jgi:hypothetical protein